MVPFNPAGAGGAIRAPGSGPRSGEADGAPLRAHSIACGGQSRPPPDQGRVEREMDRPTDRRAGGPLVPDWAGCTPAILDNQTFQPVPMGVPPRTAGVAASSGGRGMTGATTGPRQGPALLTHCPPSPSRPRLPLPDQVGRGRPMADRGRSGPRPTGADHGSHALDARRGAKSGAAMHPENAAVAGPPRWGRCNTGSRGARITQRNPKKGVRGA